MKFILKHKKLILIICLVVGAFLAYYFLILKKSATGGKALDADDEATFQQLISMFKASQFASELPYILNEYANKYAPGKPNQVDDEYGLIAGKASKTACLVRTVWNGWSGSYFSLKDGSQDRPFPKPGRTQAEADAALQLCKDFSHTFEAYKGRALAKMV